MADKTNTFLAACAKITSTLWHTPGRTCKAALSAGALSLWLTAGAAMAWTVVTTWLVWLFKGRLTPQDAFFIIETAMAVVAICILAITGREISLHVSKSGVDANVGLDDGVKVTTTTTVQPTAKEEP